MFLRFAMLRFRRAISGIATPDAIDLIAAPLTRFRADVYAMLMLAIATRRYAADFRHAF